MEDTEYMLIDYHLAGTQPTQIRMPKEKALRILENRLRMAEIKQSLRAELVELANKHRDSFMERYTASLEDIHSPLLENT